MDGEFAGHQGGLQWLGVGRVGPEVGQQEHVVAGGADDRTAVIIQPATPAAVAPLVTLAYGLSEREFQVTRLCMQGVSTRQMANVLALSDVPTGWLGKASPIPVDI